MKQKMCKEWDEKQNKIGRSEMKQEITWDQLKGLGY